MSQHDNPFITKMAKILVQNVSFACVPGIIVFGDEKADISVS